jgi:Xaa-Pro aminopeptidase
MSLNQKRVSDLRSNISDSGFDAALVLNPGNSYYLLDSNIEAAIYISQSGSHNIIISDSRYEAELSSLRAPGFKKVLRESSYIDELLKILKPDKRKRRVALESSIPLTAYLKLKKISNYRFKPYDVLSELREIKDREEIARIKRAARITADSLDCIAADLKSGISEVELGGLLELEFKKRGASGSAFSPIVAFGKKSAMPHAEPSMNKIKKSSGILLVDSGALFSGYCGDLTRTFFWDKIPKIVKKAYGVVEEVREHIFSQLSEGLRIAEAAESAYKLVEKRGFSSALRHGLGHGIGIDVHEGPSFNMSSKGEFKENMVLTVEPGLYFPGIGGVRIEDIVVIKRKGVKVL